MKLDGTYEFNAPRELVWEMLQDPEVLARILPGCEKLERVGENEFAGGMVIKVGPVQGVFQGSVQLMDRQPPHSYQLVVKGKGPQGIIEGSGRVQLQENSAGVLMAYDGQAQVSGPMASVGQRLMLSSAKAIIGQSLQNLDRQVQARLQPAVSEPPPATMESLVEERARISAETPPPSPPPPPPPSQTQFIYGVAQDVFKDLVPNPQQRQLVTVLAGVGVFFLLRGLVDWWTNRLARRIARLVQAQLQAR